MQSAVQVVTSHCRVPPHSVKQAALLAALHQFNGQAAAGFAGPAKQARVIRRADANQKSFLDMDVPSLWIEPLTSGPEPSMGSITDDNTNWSKWDKKFKFTPWLLHHI